MKPLEDGGSSQFAEAADGELFALMARRGDAGHSAWAELCRRYAKDFHRILCAQQRLSPSEADDLAQEAMIKAYQRAETFEPRDDLPRDDARRRTLGWLGSIARNIRFGQWREQKIVPAGTPDPDAAAKIPSAELHRRIRESEDHVAGRTGAGGAVSPEKQLLRDALQTLDERERDIYLTSHEYYERDQKHPHLPHAVVAELCERHKVKPAYLRKLRERAHKKVMEHIQDNSPTGSKR